MPLCLPGAEKVDNPLPAHSFHSGVNHFCQSPILTISGVEIEILFEEINQEIIFMTVDIFGCWDLNDLPYSAWLIVQGQKTTWVLSCLPECQPHFPKPLKSCDCCMSSVLPASGLEQSAGAEPGVSEDNERKLVCNLEWTWFRRSIHISMEIPSRLTGLSREIKEWVGGCNGCEKEQLELKCLC